MIKKEWILLLLIAILASCTGDKLDYADMGVGGGDRRELGGVTLSLEASEELYLKSTKTNSAAEDELQLDVDQFKVMILNSRGLVAKQWSTFAEVKDQTVKLNEGNYTLRASFGSPKVAGFGAYHFVGATEFGVAASSQSSVSTVCSLANVKVKVVYGEQLAKDYASFKTEITGVSGNKVTFARDEQRAAYFPVGNLQLKIYMTDRSGKTVSYIPNLVPAEAKDFITINMDVNSGQVTLNITTDTATDEKVVDAELPPFMSPKAPPVILPSNFDTQAWSKNFVEGESQAARITLKAPGVVRSCVVTVNSDQLADQGWPQSFDLVNIDESTKAILKRDGLVWYDGLDGTVISDIDFGGVAAGLATNSEVPAQHSFKVKVSDAFSQECQSEVLSFVVEKPVFSFAPIAVGDVWAKKAGVKVKIEKGAVEKVVVEQKSGATWVPCSVGEKVVAGENIDYMLTNLTPGTTIELRARYNGHLSVTQSISTEAITQMPNSGFETWYNKEVYKKTIWSFGTTGLGINEYYPYANGDANPWWSSRNPLTTSQRSGTSCYYTSFSGSTNVAGRTGQAAQISTIGWGEGNTFPGSPDIVKNRTAGMLFVGSYNLGSKTELLGQPFSSRPAELEFYYKYAPQGNESFKALIVVENRDSGVVELGRAELVSAEAQGQFEKVLLPIIYSNTSLKATHIYVSFISSTADSPGTSGVNGNKGAFDGYSDSKNVGSTLTIDDLQLIY